MTTYTTSTARGTSSADYYLYPISQTQSPYIYQTPGTITFEVENKKEENKMRGLYLVIIVDPRKKGAIVTKQDVIAQSADEAKLKVLAKTPLPAGLDLEDVDIAVMSYANNFIRAKKETQKVKIVKEDEE